MPNAMRRLLVLAAMLPFAAHAPAARAADRHVEIVNNTGRTMTNFYASRVGAKSWEEDILGRDTLDAGDSVTVNINDGTGACRFDFKAVFEGGASLEKGNIDVCTISSFTYNR